MRVSPGWGDAAARGTPSRRTGGRVAARRGTQGREGVAFTRGWGFSSDRLAGSCGGYIRDGAGVNYSHGCCCQPFQCHCG